MKERGIIFSAPMVRAILAGQKTQTRRIVKPQPPGKRDVLAVSGSDYHLFTSKLFGDPGVFRVCGPVWAVRKIMDREPIWKCPYGQPGDRLWVRETWQRDVDGCPCGLSYRADHRDPQGDGPSHPMQWRPSVHMPRWASRITLEVTGVRVERLQEITVSDALAEGIGHLYNYTHPLPPVDGALRFMELWDSIHGDGAWKSNPWVWVISFKKLDTVVDDDHAALSHVRTDRELRGMTKPCKHCCHYEMCQHRRTRTNAGSFPTSCDLWENVVR